MKSRCVICWGVLTLMAITLVALISRGASPRPVASQILSVNSAGVIGAVDAPLSYKVFLPQIARDACFDYRDDFSSAASGWPVAEDDDARAEYLNAEYRVLSKRDAYSHLVRAPSCDRANYTVEVDMRWEGVPGRSYGLIFALNRDFSQYAIFDMNVDSQQYRLLHRTPTGLVQVIPARHSPAILAGNASNHLKVSYSGESATLSVNGTVLETGLVARSSPLSGVGLLSSSYKGVPASDARFDNFEVTGLSSVSAPAQQRGELTPLVCPPAPVDRHSDPDPGLDW